METIKSNTVKAENQVKVNQNIFYVGEENGKKRIVVLGNSMLRHGICPEIGWHGLYGMAASAEEKDFVHRLSFHLTENKISHTIMANQIAEWERNFFSWDYGKFDEIKKFDADLIIYRAGENTVGQTDKDYYAKYLNEMINYIKGKNTKVVMSTCFWHNEIVDQGIRKVAKDNNYTLVELGDLGDDKSMLAIGKFTHPGVAVHPDDNGMENMAIRLVQPLLKILK